jgi:hypothetical protein
MYNILKGIYKTFELICTPKENYTKQKDKVNEKCF